MEKSMMAYSEQSPISNSLTADCKLSIYRDKLVNPLLFTEQAAKILKAFPKLKEDEGGWFEILKERLKANRFTCERFVDAVNNLIDTCPYPCPTIANILHFDKTVELFTDFQFERMVREYGVTLRKKYSIVKVDGKIFYAHNEDIDRYRLEIPTGEVPVTCNIKYPDQNKNPEKWKGMFAEFKTKSHVQTEDKIL